MEEIIVLNDLSRYWLRRVQVRRECVPIDERKWLQLVPDEAAEGDMEYRKLYDEVLDLYTLWIYWHTREPVELLFPKAELEWLNYPEDLLEAVKEGIYKVNAVIWWAAPGEGLRGAVDLAVAVFFTRFGRWPSAALVKRKPAEAGERVEYFDFEGKGKELDLFALDWVVDRYVVVV